MNRTLNAIFSMFIGISVFAQNAETSNTTNAPLQPADSKIETKGAVQQETVLSYSLWIGHTLDRHTGVFNFTNIEGNSDIARSRQVNSTYHIGFGILSKKFETVLGLSHCRPVVDFGFLELEDPFTYDYTLVDLGFEERYHILDWGKTNSAYLSLGFGGSTTRSAYQNKGSQYVDLLDGPVKYVPDFGTWYSYGIGIQHSINEKHRLVVGVSGRNRLNDYELDPIDLLDPNQIQKLTFNSIGIYAALGIRL